MNNDMKINLNVLKEKSKNLTVLYIEDEENLRTTTAFLLNKLFQNVDVAVDGKEGLDKYNAGKYDLIITDLSMPNMNGDELIANIRKVNLAQEIIIMSAYTDKVKEFDISGYIYKPVDLNQMLEVINCSVEKLNI